MNANEFESALIQLGLSKAELARRLGVHPTTVYRWGVDIPVPGYAVAYLDCQYRLNQVVDEMDAMQRGSDGG